MSDKVRIADLPTSTNIDKDSYMIVERPNEGQGTFKTTLGDIQEAITVRAKTIQTDNVTFIIVKDITGTTETRIITPTAKVRDNGDGTVTITITDTEGTTEVTSINYAVIDSGPIEGGEHAISSGAVWTVQHDMQQEIENQIASVNESIGNLQSQITDLGNAVNALGTRIDTAEGAIEGINSAIESINSAIEGIEGQLTAIEETEIPALQQVANDALVVK